MRLQRVPFFVIAAHWLDRLGGAFDAGASVLTGGVELVDEAPGIGGLQIPQGPYRCAASLSFIGIELLRRELQPALWYFVPVFVTYTVTSAASTTMGSRNAMMTSITTLVR